MPDGYKAMFLLIGFSFLLAPRAVPESARPIGVKASASIARGIAFIQRDAEKWKAERKCSTCHHGAMTVYALNEAKHQGYSVDASAIADLTAWTKERLASIEKPRDPNPGAGMINTVALFLGSMARNLPDENTLPKDDVDQIARHIARHLESDGSVLTPATMDPPMAKNGPPPVFESREVMTLLAALEMRSADLKSNPEVRDGLAKADFWLLHATPGDDIQAMALRLELAVQEKKSRDVRSGIETILKRQNPDGGWGQIRGAISDAFATGRALYDLSIAGVNRNRSEIQHAIAWLVANQNPDGSWKMIPRAHPGVSPMTHPEPITHIGSAWGLIGLVRSVPPANNQASGRAN